MTRQGQSLLITIAGVLLLGINSALSQVSEAWTVRYNGPANGIDKAVAVAVDNAGHVYVAGTSAGAGSGQDYAVLKCEADGTPSPTWPDIGFGVGVRRYNGIGNTNDVLSAMVVDGQGNVYVTGTSDSWDTPTYSSPYMGNYDIVTVKYGPAGEQVWVAKYHKSVTDSALSVALDAAGNVYVLGNVTMNYYPYQGGAYILKYTSAGTLSSSWPDTGFGAGVRRYPAVGVAFKVRGDGSVYSTGYAQEGSAAPDYNVVTWQYDAGGNQVWASFYRGLAQYDVDKPKAIALDDSGHVYVAGESGPPGTSTPGPIVETYDYVVLKYEPDGSVSSSWADAGQGAGVRRYDGPGHTNDFARSLTVDNAGNVYVAGISQRATNSIFDFMTVKYDAAGNLSETWPDAGWGVGVRLKPYAASTTSTTPVVALDPMNNPVMAGLSPVSGGIFSVFAYEGGTGAASWSKSYSGPGPGIDEPFALAVDAAGSVYVAGRSTGVGTSDDFVGIKYVPNSAPVANAGLDQTAAVGDNCQASVTLDGSGSSDPDNDALTFAWAGSFGTATGATPTVALGTGVHTIMLTVDDGKGGTNSDTVVITVVDATPPTVIAPPGTTASADATGQALIPNVLPGVGAIDNCTPTGNLNLWQSPLPGTAVGLGTHTITVYASDSAGNQGIATTTFTVNDTTPPTVTAPAGTTASAGANGLAAVPDVLAGVVAADNCTPVDQLAKSQIPAAGTLVGLGTHTITIGVADAAGNLAAATTTFTVVDTTAPVIQSLTASPSTLSATGKLVLVKLSASVTDNADPAPQTRIISVTANEPLKAPGAGVKNPDYQITGDLTLYLRAKSSTKAGRVYTITVESKDVAGNRSTATVNVRVATSCRKGD